MKRPYLLRFTVIVMAHLKFIDCSSLWKAKLEKKKKPKFTIFFSLKLPNYTFQKYILNDLKHLSNGGRGAGCGGSFGNHINCEGMQNAVYFFFVSFCFQICYQPFKKSLNFRFLKRPSSHSNLPFHQSLWCFHLIFDFLKFIAFESDISQKCLLVPIIKSVSQGTLLPASQIPRSPFSTFSPLIRERGKAFLPLLINRLCGSARISSPPCLLWLRPIPASFPGICNVVT